MSIDIVTCSDIAQTSENLSKKKEVLKFKKLKTYKKKGNNSDTLAAIQGSRIVGLNRDRTTTPVAPTARKFHHMIAEIIIKDWCDSLRPSSLTYHFHLSVSFGRDQEPNKYSIPLPER